MSMAQLPVTTGSPYRPSTSSRPSSRFIRIVTQSSDESAPCEGLSTTGVARSIFRTVCAAGEETAAGEGTHADSDQNHYTQHGEKNAAGHYGKQRSEKCFEKCVHLVIV